MTATPNHALQRTVVSRRSRPVRTLPPVIFLWVLLAVSSAFGNVPPERIVSDPIASYFHRHILAEGMRANIQTIEADFDCDGHSDFAITDSIQGKSGAWWVLYLWRGDGQFAEIGTVGTKANRFHISRQKSGGARLAVMLRGGSGEFVVSYYSIASSTLRKTGEERIHIPEEQTGKTRIDEIFGPGYSELPATTIPFAELQARFQK